MGWHLEGGTEEEDQSHEEAAQADGRQSAEGCHGIEQVQRMWENEARACGVSILRQQCVERAVCPARAVQY
jgi:hypothetical protein